MIAIEGVGKRYTLGRARGGSDAGLRHTLEEAIRNPLRFVRRRKDMAKGGEEFWALRDISLEVQQGDVVGIIGRNGAGKSTLLKILSRITEPTKGRITLNGRVASLLEVGTGFHQELTGRENIFLNGAILGMTRNEIRKKFDEIVSFSEVEKFLDTPVKRYSSGMYVRLAFAVAAHLEPEVLVVDEVLAVGDFEFQRKCLGKMKDVAQGGRTVLFVSHNMTALRQLCTRAVLLDKGTVQYSGLLHETIARYLDHEGSGRAIYRLNGGERPAGKALIQEVLVAGENGNPTASIVATERVCVSISVDCQEALPPCQLAVRVSNEEGVPVFTTTNADASERMGPLRKGVHRFNFTVPPSFLAEGRYTLTLCLCIPGVEAFSTLNDAVSFDIVNGVNHATRFHDQRKGVVTPLLDWKHLV